MAEKLKKAPMRWSYVPGGYNRPTHRLRRAGVDIAIVAPAAAGGWYSYGLGDAAGWKPRPPLCGRG